MPRPGASPPPGDIVFVVGYRRSDRFEDDIGTVRHASCRTGFAECLPSALAEGGHGFGTGISESERKSLAAKARFARCTRAMPEDPIHNFFALAS
jgi:hypothetical protein